MGKPFSKQVLEAIEGRDVVMATDLLQAFPDKSEREISKAFQNLRIIGQMEQVQGKVRGEHGVFRPAVWRVVKPAPQPVEIPRVSSVWGLVSGPVEILPMPGRVFSPLGAWQE